MRTIPQAPVQTAKVSNAMVGDKELSFTLTAGSEADVTDILIFPGAFRTSTERSTIKSGITFSSTSFASFEQMVNYLHAVNTQVYGARIETDDVANFNTGQVITFFEKDPAGDESQPVKLKLSAKRTPVGDSYSNVIELSEKELKFLIWPGLDVKLAFVKKTKSITFYFKVRGWGKVKELSALPANIIS